jgi:oligoendopeptidase F
MFRTLPTEPVTLLEWNWSNFEPYYQNLQQRPLNADTAAAWLKDWTLLSACIDELQSRLSVLVSVNTADEQAETRYKAFFDDIYPQSMAAEQVLKEKLLASGLEPEGFEIPLRNMRSEASLFRTENLPLQAEENKRKLEYDKIVGAQTVVWEGVETTVEEMSKVFQESDRARREQAWRLVAERQLADREAINKVWGQLLDLRLQMAANAGMPDYRAYRWQEMLRFDYSPDDARRFQDAIEEVVVPAAARVLERRRQRLGLDVLRPWDLNVDPLGRPPLRPYQSQDSFKQGLRNIFQRVSPEFGGYFDQMEQDQLLDLENRKNKAPGGYCTSFAITRRPFIFMNAVGMHDDVQTLLHEGGHAFHVYESAQLPYYQQLNAPIEFAEVASMGMELLAAPYLTRDQGGFYSPAEAASARLEHLQRNVLFWPYMAVVDAFQHWVYTNPEAAADPSQCDAAWAGLWRRFMPLVDWSGLEDVMVTGWHRKLHIHLYPFYYIEYGLAQLGAVQVWSNALEDQAAAVRNYRQALSLGGMVTLPQLFKAAGARFAFDSTTLRKAVELIEKTIELLEAQIA